MSRFVERKVVHYLDSARITSHINNNPSKYTYHLPSAIPNVVGVKMLSYMMPYSPTFIIIRVSDWETSTANFDAIHTKALWLEARLKTFASIEVASTVASIVNTDSSVALSVVECFTFVNTDVDEGTTRYKTYDVFICTGLLNTVARTGWSLSIAELGTITSMTADAGSSISVVVDTDSINMHLSLGQAGGRLQSHTFVSPEWQSFRVYRRGEEISRDGTKYVCVENHMSLIFQTDLSTFKYWKTLPESSERFQTISGANDAFYIFESTDENQVVLREDTSNKDISMSFKPFDVTSITVEFLTNNRTHFIFPYTAAIDFLSFSGTGSDIATISKNYLSHRFALEITYLEENVGFVPFK